MPAPALDGAAERYDALPVVLALTPQPGEHGYRAQLADDDGFARIRQQWTVAAPRLRLEGLPDGIHYLRLRALDADDLPGVALEYRFRLKTTPVAPLPQAPVQDAVLPTGRIAVQCSGIPDAAGFLLQYGPDAGFTAAATRSERARDCRFELAQDRPAVLYWRVATLEGMGDDAERGPFSDASRLRVVPAPQAPVLTLESGERIQAHWGAVPDTRFRVQLARDLAFAELVADTTVDEPRVSFDVGARCRPYFIRLQAIDQYGLQSAFSPPRRVDPDRAVCDTRGEPVMQQDGRSVRRGSAG
ncbi:hypothetical protein GCM10007860_35510 [Chitiniphilus shinanonensis]|uniref:Uncharacterized protein n=1 Tax=Chitiniphilus shinanonensis TaxID=553088 RepID=A0ABQ6BYZ5_9NEIS|nr:hypothetical protein GCM10007860_35510 [Chitiniphilus shinanonensis]